MVEGLAGAPSEANATYPYADIAAGTGTTLYYAGRGGSANSFILTPYKFYSSPFISFNTGLSLTGSFALAYDIDFDVVLNKQVTVKGTFIMNVPIAVKSNSTDQIEAYAIIKIRKWDGSTETELSTSGQSNTLNSGGVSAIVYMMPCPVVVVPNSIIKSGETLRMTVEIYWKRATGSSGGEIRFAYDPQGRTSDTSFSPAQAWDTTGANSSVLTLPLPTRIFL